MRLQTHPEIWGGSVVCNAAIKCVSDRVVMVPDFQSGFRGFESHLALQYITVLTTLSLSTDSDADQGQGLLIKVKITGSIVLLDPPCDRTGTC